MSRLSTSNPRSPVVILLVEDNDGDVLLINDALAECGVPFEIRHVKNGAEALEYLRELLPEGKVSKPDLVLLDINIPIYNGHEVLKEIRNDSLVKDLTVFMLTTSDNEEDIKQAEVNRANDYLKKPVDLYDYQKMVARLSQYFLNI